MGCLPENTIQELVGGGLPDDARAQAHLHIETCAACRQLVIELARDGDLDGIACPDERPPDSLFIGALRTVVNTGSPRDRSGLATQIGQYEIIRLLGRGGMGEVHLARDLRLGRLVAVKLLATRNQDLEVRFLAEARATARCHHENIVVIHEVGTHMGRPYMVLEYLEGQTLRHWLSDHAATAGRPARVPPARAVELMLPVVRALAYAHDQGIVHRDLKPENVMLTRSRRHEGPPFAGLAAFQEADAGRFFGRDRDIERVVAELRSRPLVAVVGPSGAGKSSLVRAGVIPALKRSGEGWDTHIVRPGREPPWQSSRGWMELTTARPAPQPGTVQTGRSHTCAPSQAIWARGCAHSPPARSAASPARWPRTPAPCSRGVHRAADAGARCDRAPGHARAHPGAGERDRATCAASRP